MADDTIKDNQDISDQVLVQQTLSHSAAFEHLIRRYKARLERYIRRITRAHEQEVDIILQDVFIKTYINLNDYDQSLSFSSWIYRIAHNESIDYLRKTKRKHESLDKDDEEDAEQLINRIASEDNIIVTLDERILKEHVSQILSELSPDHRSVLTLRYLEDKKYDEISDILKKPAGTVSTLLHRAKQSFEKKASELNITLRDL